MNVPDSQAIFRAWLRYIALYAVVAVPVRLAAPRVLPALGPGSPAPWLVAGAALLPVSFLLYRRSVRRLAATAGSAVEPRGR